MTLIRTFHNNPMVDFFNDFLAEKENTFHTPKKNVPSVNILEQEKSFNIELAAPGLKKEDFQLKLDNEVLTISVEQNEEKEAVEKKYTRKEFCYTCFNRSFTIPENVDVENITATYEAGVLNINLPKKEEQPKLSRSINIS